MLKKKAIFSCGEKLLLVSEIKYLDVTLDSRLSFKNHMKRKFNNVKFNSCNFKKIQPFIKFDGVTLFLHSMTLSHI